MKELLGVIHTEKEKRLSGDNTRILSKSQRLRNRHKKRWEERGGLSPSISIMKNSKGIWGLDGIILFPRKESKEENTVYP